MSLLRIVGVTGFTGCGKDTFADVLVTEGGYERVAFSDAAVRECAAWLGLSIEDFRVRAGEFEPMLERHVVERREKFPNYWRDYVGRRVRESDAERFVVPDVSSATDAEYLQSCGGEIVRVVRDGKLDPTTDSERVVHDVAYDWYVDGRGVEHLREQARDLLRRWRESPE